MAEEDCFAGFDHRTLAAIVASYVAHLRKERSHPRALSKVGRIFGHEPEVVDLIVNRLLPKFLLKILDKKSGRLSSFETSVTRSYLTSFMNNGCCHIKALAEAAIEHNKHSFQIEALLRQTLWKLVFDLKPLSSRTPNASSVSRFA